MTIDWAVYELREGQAKLIDASLANVVILRIVRTGTGYNKVFSAIITDRQCQHVVSEGRLQFLNVASAGEPLPQDPVGVGEKVYVRFKY